MSTAPLPASADPGAQAALFRRLRWRLLTNGARAFHQAGSLRLFSIVVCSLLIWFAVFLASLAGFDFMASKGLSLVGGLTEILFDLLFFALGTMLVFSSGIILYSSLFGSAESAFLLTTPAAADQVFAYKFHGAVSFSSWAFLLLGSPILIAHGLAFKAAWYFYVLLPFFFLGFVLLPGALGGAACLLIVNYVPKRRKQAVVAAVVLLIIPLGLWLSDFVSATKRQSWSRDAVQDLLGRFSFLKGEFMPPHWMARGLQAVERGRFLGSRYNPGALHYLGLLWGNGLVGYVVAAWLAKRLYRRGYNRIATGGSLRRRYGTSSLDAFLARTLAFFDPQTRLLIVKDFRTFRRDPSQWAQILIFTGLMTLYFINIRKFYAQEIGSAYRNGVSLLNLAATALLLCTYTSRFIYPLLSLEGRKFWILGLLPLKRDRLLWGKFAFSATGALVVAEVLVLLSDIMLEMPALAVLVHLATTAALALGLSGLSVGLGACMPNFRETDPSKIAVGFGGTLNLVAGLLFLLLTIALVSGPWHLQCALEGNDVEVWRLAPWAYATMALGLVLGMAAVVVPLRAGARALRQMEF